MMAPRTQYRILFVGTAFIMCARGSVAFTCDGGATVLEHNRVNDDYCDCRDGTDENLTPACSYTGQARFVCTDTGALYQTIPTSRLWDGVCDCCDGSDELVAWGGSGSRWGAAVFASSATVGSAAAAGCNRNGCKRLLEEARARAIEVYERVEAGLAARSGREEESARVAARWQATLRAGEVNEDVRKQELKAVEKLEVLLKVYLQDEERKERRERVQLAKRGRCEKNSRRERGQREGESGPRGRTAAAALGPCEDNTAETEAAAKVRTARAAARARLDASEDEEEEHRKNSRRGKADRNKASRGGSREGGKGHRKDSRGSSGGRGGGLEGAATAEHILGIEWVIDMDAGHLGVRGGLGGGGDDDHVLRDPSKGSSEADADGNTGGGGREERGKRAEATVLSLRTYVKQRQAGSAAAKGGLAEGEEKKAEELRKTALLGPVLNDGQRGAHLGLTILLRLVGLPLLSPLRGLVAACVFARDQAARAAAALATDYLGLAPSSIVRVALEGYRDLGLPGISSHLDYRRYPALRSVVLRWDAFLEGEGRFLLVMWDAPVALWDYFFPERDDEHERPEAAMLREGIARARAILQDGGAGAAGKAGGGASSRGKHRREEAEAKRLSGLDLGEGRRFAALAEKCLELREGGYVYSLCPFKEAKQDKHSLGRWKGWGPGLREAGPGGWHGVMLFDGGSRCPNRKQRSCEVLVECGSEDALVAAEEVEMGMYRLRLETPLACTEADLVEAQRGLEALDFALPSEEGLRPEEPLGSDSLESGRSAEGKSGGVEHREEL